jgi:diguanylate cyclase (GGDEF)-like protein
MAMDFAERLKVGQRLEYVAFYDVLTGLPNRTLLVDRLTQAIPQSARCGQMLAICHLNLDAFKPINDGLGRQIGDAVLAQLAHRLQDSLRQGDSVARVGGDDLALILTSLDSPHEGLEAAQRLLEVINQPIEVRGHRLHLSASMGLTLYPMDSGGPDALLRHAQEAMYQAKSHCRGGYHLYTPVQAHQELEERQRRQDFALALRTGQLELHFQPKVDLSDGRVIGLEALLRWRHPRDGLLDPGRFLPLIKGTPLEIALDEWVLAAALDQRQHWREAGLDLAISVNISPRYLQMQDLGDFLARTLADYPAHAGTGLEIEILEADEIRDPQAAARVMSACKALGCTFSLDDFGTGFASLTYLHQLPIDKVKIDQRFVRNLLDNPKDLAIVEGVLQMARVLPWPVLAEGIESLEVGFLLHQLGCHDGQGFAIARPMPPDMIPGWLESWAGERHWHSLAAATATGVAPDLGVALFSLRHWLDDILVYLRGDRGRTLPPLDQHQCQFCRWYHGIGEVRYGARPRYAFIQARHHRLHALALELVDEADANPTRMVQERIGQLEVLGEELVTLLWGLAR